MPNAFRIQPLFFCKGAICAVYTRICFISRAVKLDLCTFNICIAVQWQCNINVLLILKQELYKNFDLTLPQE